jgi:hypothetical protein
MTTIISPIVLAIDITPLTSHTAGFVITVHHGVQQMDKKFSSPGWTHSELFKLRQYSSTV